MSLSLSNCYIILSNRLHGPLGKLGYDPEMVESNTSLTRMFNPVIGSCLQYFGVTPDSYVAPTTAEVSELENDDVNDFLDLAEYHLLGRLLGEITDVDERLGPHGKWSGQYPERLRKMHSELGKKLETRLGLSSARIELGTVEVKWIAEEDNDS